MDSGQAANSTAVDQVVAARQQAFALLQQGCLDEARIGYDHVLRLQPQDTVALNMRGIIALQMNDPVAAVDLIGRALLLEPDDAVAHMNLGSAYCMLNEHQVGIACYDEAIAIDSASTALPTLYRDRGRALARLARYQDAIDSFNQALALKPGYADVLNALGDAHRELGQYDMALAAYEMAIHASPGFIVAINNAGCLLRALGQIDDAERMLRRGLAIDPCHAMLVNNLGNVLKDAGDVDGAIACYRRALELDPDAVRAHSNLAYALSFQTEDADAILDTCRHFNQRFAAPLGGHRHRHVRDRSLQRRLRIGYVSPDFRDHCQSLFTLPLLAHHDRTAFEIICYSSVAHPDEWTSRIRRHADLYREVGSLDDTSLAAVIRQDRVDILVDLTMHMANGRPLLFARRPAPLQVAWLAYPGTTGIDAIDYRFSDPRLDPVGCDARYSERTVRLPDAFWCYDPMTTAPEVNPLPAAIRGHVTLGCLNNPCKLSERTLRLWAPVLAGLPRVRLLLMLPPGRHRGRFLDRASTCGIDPLCIDFVGYRARSEYLASYHDIDLALDTLPYNGHTSSLDALWMGVPVVTRIGATCAGRAGLSQLYQLGLTELAADSDDEFVDVALALARDLSRLASLRRGLRARLERSALMDGGRFAAGVEAAYRAIWCDQG